MNKVNIKDIPDKASHTKLLEDSFNKQSLAIAQEIVDRFALYLKYPFLYRSHFMHQVKTSETSMPAKVKDLVCEALEPLGWQVSCTWNSTTLSYEVTIK